MREVVHVVEPAHDLPGPVEPPVVQRQHQIAVDLGRFGFLDDQRRGQPARDLLECVAVRMVPVGTGIGGHEVIGEGSAGWDRVLGHARHAVHGVVESQPMPVDRRRLRQVVDQLPYDPVALCDAQPGARGCAVIGPDLRCRVVLGQKLRLGGRGRHRGFRETCGHWARSKRGGGSGEKGASGGHRGASGWVGFH